MRRVRLVAFVFMTGACAQIEGLSRYHFDSAPPSDSGVPLEQEDAAATGDGSTPPDAGATAPPPNLCGDTSGVLANAAWPLVHGCPTNSGRSPFHAPRTGGTELAPFGTIGDNRGAVVNGAGVVFLEESGEGDVYAFDIATGEQKWMAQTHGSGTSPVTALDRDGVLYASTNYGMFFAIDSGTGAILWQTQLAGVLSPAVISAPGVAFVGSNAYGFYAVDLAAHQQKWHLDIPGPDGGAGDTSAAPAVGNGVVYAVDSATPLLLAIDPADGTKKFAAPIPGAPTGSPVLGVDAVYVATDQGIAALDPVTGAVAWQSRSLGPVVQPALLSYGEVVSATTGGHAFVLDPKTGTELRGTDLGANVALAPIVAVDDVVVFSTDKGIMAVTKGSTLAWSSLLSGPIVFGDGRVVVMPNGQTFGVIGP